MITYADPARCPGCRASLAGSSRCPECGLELGGELGSQLLATLSTADSLLQQLRAASPLVPATSGPAAQVPAATPAAEPAPTSAPFGDPSGAGRARPEPVIRLSVPAVLLGTGALCLLAAALVFLAVTWETLGVGGRTLALLAVTSGAAVVTAWSASRGLRAAVEALGAVTTGLVALDLVGGWYAGWLGDLSEPGLVVVVGAALVAGGWSAAALMRRSPAGGFAGGRVAAVLGSVLVAGGLVGGWWVQIEARLLVAVLVTAGLTVAAEAARRSGLLERLDVVAMAVVPVGAWSGLFLTGLERATATPDLAAVLGDGAAWPLVAAALLTVPVVLARVLPSAARVTAAGAGLAVAAAVVVTPALDEPSEVLLGTVLVLVALAVVGLGLAPRPWAAAGLGVAALGALPLTVATTSWLGTAATRYGLVASTEWDGSPWTRFGPTPVDLAASPWLVTPTLLVLAALAWSVLQLQGSAVSARTALVAVAATAATGLLTVLVLLPTPVWLVLAVLLCAGAGAAAMALRTGVTVLSGTAVAVLIAGLLLGAHDEALTAAALSIALVTAAAYLALTPRPEEALAAGLAVPLLAAGLLWTGGVLADVSGRYVALVGILLVAVLASLRPPRRDRSAGVETGSLLAAAAVAALGLATVPLGASAGWLAGYLTLVGAAVTIHSLLHADRRPAGWLGGGFLAAATWVRLADLGVEQPEPYTLPTALALVVVGLLHLRRSPNASTFQALGPGLALALLPSLIWVYQEPFSLRAVLLGMACLALVVVGVQLGWSALLTYGATVGVLVVLRETAPLIGNGVPRWVLFGIAGTVLVAMGVSWEQRTRDARAVLGYVRRLR